MSKNIFSRSEKTLSGVCSHLSTKKNIKPVYLRVAFIVAYFIVGIISPILYLILAMSFGKMTKKISLAIIGAILGIPLSYYFQSEILKNEINSIVFYIKCLFTIFARFEIKEYQNILVNLLLSILVYSFIGGLIGYFIDKNETKSKS
jgi:phage shock protein PspC (stress-responsive transcriptional regulator)